MSVLLSSLFPRPIRPGWKARTRRGLTLIEVMVAAGVLVITGVGGFSGFLLLNRQAANMRNLSMARALCQERIEQGLTLPFRPGATTPVVPTAPSADPTNTVGCTILGVATNYTNGAFTAGANTQTSTETIPVFTKAEATSTTTDATVVYTRTSTVSAGGLGVVGSDGTASTTSSLNTVLFTVNVGWTFRGQTYSTTMSTLRSPD